MLPPVDNHNHSLLLTSNQDMHLAATEPRCSQIACEFAKAIFPGLGIGATAAGLATLIVAAPYAALIGVGVFVMVELITALYLLRVPKENKTISQAPPAHTDNDPLSTDDNSPSAPSTNSGGAPAIPAPPTNAEPPKVFTATGTEVINTPTRAALTDALAASTSSAASTSPIPDTPTTQSAKITKTIKESQAVLASATKSEIINLKKDLEFEFSNNNTLIKKAEDRLRKLYELHTKKQQRIDECNAKLASATNDNDKTNFNALLRALQQGFNTRSSEINTCQTQIATLKDKQNKIQIELNELNDIKIPSK